MGKIGVFTKIFRYEQTAKRAIESVLSQTFSEFNYYILVNEKTKELVKYYAMHDERIHILIAKDKSENLSSYIKEIAKKHSYVFILDGDDWIDKGCLEELYQYAEQEKLDITFCGNTFESKGVITGKRGVEKSFATSKQVALFYLSQTYQYVRTMWGKLWKSTLFEVESTLPDSKKIGGYGGDTLKCFFLLNRAETFGGIAGYPYHYQINPVSTSYKLKEGRQKADAVLYNYVLDILRKNKYALTEENVLFLLCVYKVAVRDTLCLINYTDISTEEKCKVFIEVIECLITKELLLLESKRGGLDGLQNQLAIVQFSEVIFQPILKALIKEKEILYYYPVFTALFQRYKDIVTEELFVFLSLHPKIFIHCITMNETLFCIEMLCHIANIKSTLAKQMMHCICNISSDNLLRKSSHNIDFVMKHPTLIISLYRKRYEEAAFYCQKQLEQQKNKSFQNDLIEVLLNTSAFSENVDLFLYGKFFKMKYAFSIGDKETAKLELEDLKEMGVKNELIYQYESVLN